MLNDSMNQLASYYHDHFKLLRAGKRKAANEQYEKYSALSERLHLRNSLGRQYYSVIPLQPSKLLETFERLELKIKEARKVLDQSVNR
jgi:hypothetical protein